jgi:ribosomal protein S2
MKNYIYEKNSKFNNYVFDLNKIANSCNKIEDYLKSFGRGKNILFLSTKKQSKDSVREAAIRCGMPHVVNK